AISRTRTSPMPCAEKPLEILPTSNPATSKISAENPLSTGSNGESSKDENTLYLNMNDSPGGITGKPVCWASTEGISVGSPSKKTTRTPAKSISTGNEALLRTVKSPS